MTSYTLIVNMRGRQRNDQQYAMDKKNHLSHGSACEDWSTIILSKSRQTMAGALSLNPRNPLLINAGSSRPLPNSSLTSTILEAFVFILRSFLSTISALQESSISETGFRLTFHISSPLVFELICKYRTLSTFTSWKISGVQRTSRLISELV